MADFSQVVLTKEGIRLMNPYYLAIPGSLSDRSYPLIFVIIVLFIIRHLILITRKERSVVWKQSKDMDAFLSILCFLLCLLVLICIKDIVVLKN